MRILVTGANGFIGNALTVKLVEAGHELHVVDKAKRLSKIKLVSSSTSGDLADPEFTKNFLESLGPLDVIFHLAGQSSAEASMTNIEGDFADNYLSTKYLLYSAMGSPHFIYASTMAVYGDALGTLVETSIARPVSNYGLHKRMSERLLHRQTALANVTVARLFNVYGPGQNLDRLDQGMVSIYAAMAVRHSEFQIKGSLNRRRDLVFIDDVVSILEKIALGRNLGHQTINISSGVLLTVKEILGQIETALGRTFPVRILPETRGDVRGFAGSTSIREKIIGSQELVSAEKGIQLFINYVRRSHTASGNHAS